MKIHIIKSAEVDDGLQAGVISLLQANPGPMQFIGQQEIHVCESRQFFSQKDFIQWDRERKIPLDIGTGQFRPPRKSVHWIDMFSECQTYRNRMRIDNQEMVILLTSKTNHRNWFSSLDPNMPSNGFVHTADWDLYMDAPPEFPIAYEVIALAFQQHLYGNWEKYKHLVHQSPKGCLNDFCQDKKEIMLKLRTADICAECLQVLQKHHPLQIIEHGLALIESLRTKMLFAQNFRQNAAPSRVRIDRQKRIFLTDYANMEINLRPLERALYLLFLRQTEGILMSNLCDHRQELLAIYSELCEIGDRNDIHGRIEDLTNVLSNSASEKISRIKRSFEQSLGPVLSKQYYIQGERGGERFIALDRSMVNFE